GPRVEATAARALGAQHRAGGHDHHDGALGARQPPQGDSRRARPLCPPVPSTPTRGAGARPRRLRDRSRRAADRRVARAHDERLARARHGDGPRRDPGPRRDASFRRAIPASLRKALAARPHSAGREATVTVWFAMLGPPPTMVSITATSWSTSTRLPVM